MRKGLLLLTVLLLLSGSVGASEITREQAEVFGVEQVEQGLPEAAREALQNQDATQPQDFVQGASRVFSGALSGSIGGVKAAAGLMLRILMIVVCCCLVENGRDNRRAQAAAWAGALAVTACCITDLKGMIGLGTSTMDEISSFSSLLLPVMASAAAAAGSVTRAGVLGAVAAVFSDLLIRCTSRVLIPATYGYLALAVVDAAMQENRLKKLQDLLAWAIRFGLKGLMYLYTGFLGLTGVLTGSADAAALKAAKATLSGVVPVVGGIISDAADSVLAGAELLKSAVGTFGMLAVLAVFLTPFLRMGLQFLAFKLTAALSGILGSRLGGLLDAMSQAMGFLLAMTASSMLMCMVCCCCLMRTVAA